MARMDTPSLRCRGPYSRSAESLAACASGINAPSGPVRAGAPGVGQQHHREQAPDLARTVAIARKEGVNRPGKPNRLAR
jgi:hypothetical protein